MRLCSVEGCGKKHLAKGLCQVHYLRVYKHGRLELAVMRGAPVLERIAAKVEMHADGCWLFTGGLTPNGYGHIRVGRKMRIAHVVTYEAKHGPVPAGLELDHTCRRRACCNPDHLEPVSHAVNVRRGVAGHDWQARERNQLGQFGAKDKGFI